MIWTSDLFGVPTKRCPFCGKERELWQYYRSRSSADGLQSYCKECQRRYKALHPQKEWKQHKNDTQTLTLW